MNNKILSFLVLFMYITASFSQNELNPYKYIIVPKKYDIFKGEEDKYQLNSLTEFLFDKNGFNTLFQDEDFPQDLLLNPCLGLIVDVTEVNKLLTTRLKIELSDCHNKIVYTSVEGVTREKEFKKAYQEALRAAFVSFEAMNYEYDPSLVANRSATPKTNESVSSTTAPSEPISKTESRTDSSVEPVVVPVVAVEEDKSVEVSAVNSIEEPKPNEAEAKQTESVTEVKPAPVVVPVATENQEVVGSSSPSSGLKSYKNENISFFIIEQEGKLKAYVNETRLETYKKGELLATFVKTSIPNVYRVSWKDKEGKKKETTGHFDEKGNLKIDVNRNGEIEVLIFEVE